MNDELNEDSEPDYPELDEPAPLDQRRTLPEALKYTSQLLDDMDAESV